VRKRGEERKRPENNSLFGRVAIRSGSSTHQIRKQEEHNFGIAMGGAWVAISQKRVD